MKNLQAFVAEVTTTEERLEIKALAGRYGFMFVQVSNTVVTTEEIFTDAEEFQEWLERMEIREVHRTQEFFRELATV